MNGYFSPHEVQWSSEHVRRFWAHLADSPQADRTYFSSHSGDAILAFAERHVPLKGSRVLDYGCGPGFLIQSLLHRGVHAEGLDFSAEAVDKARKRCGDHPLFGGVTLADRIPTPIENGDIDIVFLVEVLEHLPPQQVVQTMQEIRRILRVGGFLVATTPHNEDLEILKTICPDCGCIFHPWQHVNSFSTTRLAQLLQGHGMETIICNATTLGGRWPGKVLRFLQHMFARPGAANVEPHLVYIGRKVK